jgi:hypothetical protein
MVKPDEAIWRITSVFPVEAVQMWDYLTKPDRRALFVSSSSAEVDNADRGRIGEGTIYRCAHGKSVHPQTIVDWQPFETLIIGDELPAGMA